MLEVIAVEFNFRRGELTATRIARVDTKRVPRVLGNLHEGIAKKARNKMTVAKRISGK